MTHTTVDQLRAWARGELEICGHQVAPREANLLIGLALGWDEIRVLTQGQTELSPHQIDIAHQLIERRCAGTPFAYLAGKREFYGREFSVDRRVLIPRPETEHLIDAVIALNPSPERILDIGTGSGCIAITLALEIPQATVTATDSEIAAIAVAQANRDRLCNDHSRVQLVAADLAAGLDLTAFDTIVSNPPYVATGDELPATVADFEPSSALFADDSGLSYYRRLLGPQPPFLSGQRVVLELGANQRSEVESIAAQRFEREAIRTDLAGWERIIVLTRR